MHKYENCRYLKDVTNPDTFLRNILIVYFNKGRGMDICPYRLHIL
jgi:hypothetical protein